MAGSTESIPAEHAVFEALHLGQYPRLLRLGSFHSFTRHVEKVVVDLGAGRENLIVGTRKDAGLVCVASFPLQTAHRHIKIEIETAHGFGSYPCVVSILPRQCDGLQSIERQFV